MTYPMLLETLADLSYIAIEENCFTGDRRSDISNFILWAEECQRLNLKTDWSITDYRESIEMFTRQKLVQS